MSLDKEGFILKRLVAQRKVLSTADDWMVHHDVVHGVQPIILYGRLNDA